MRIGSRPRTGIAFAAALSCLAIGLALPASAPAGAAAPKPTKLLGPVLTRDETGNLTLGRDAGMSVALPNGKDLWVFGDTPKYQFVKGKWTLKIFIAGSSAAEGPYARGHLPKPMNEVRVGHKSSSKNQATVFIPAPKNLYFPGGSGKECSRANGAAEEGRWPTGAALMPNKSYVLVTYAEVCVPAVPTIAVEGWGFVLYNWKTNRIAAGPVDVLKPARSGAAISPIKTFGSPIVSGKNVTLFSYTCCSPGHVYTTTVAANFKALSKPGSYVSRAVSGLPTSFYVSVSGTSPTQPRIQLFELTDDKGRFAVYTAPNARGPWKRRATGLLPGCRTSPQACYAMYTHPELSNAGQLMVSYYLPGYGPGVKGHPYPHPPINHLVMASIPY